MYKLPRRYSSPAEHPATKHIPQWSARRMVPSQNGPPKIEIEKLYFSSPVFLDLLRLRRYEGHLKLKRCRVHEFTRSMLDCMKRCGWTLPSCACRPYSSVPRPTPKRNLASMTLLQSPRRLAKEHTRRVTCTRPPSRRSVQRCREAHIISKDGM